MIVAGSPPGLDGELVDAGRWPPRSELGEPHVCHTSAYLATSGSVRSGPAAADPDRRVGLLHRRRQQLGVLQRHDLALVGHDLAGEQPLHDLEGVLEQVEARRTSTGTGCRARGAPCRTTPRRARARAGRATRGRSSSPARRTPTGAGRSRRSPAGRAGSARSTPASAASVVMPSNVSPGPVAVHRLEVVEAPGAVEAELLGELDAADRARPTASVVGRRRVRSAWRATYANGSAAHAP